MRLNRFLKRELIDLHFEPLADTPDPWEVPSSEELLDSGEEEEEDLSAKALWEVKEKVLGDLVALLERSGRVSNPRKLFTDLRNREAKASTAMGKGVAMPHVRTIQAKGFALGVALAPEPGLPFDAIDDEPVRIFIPMVAPPHDDRFYLKVERALAAGFADSDDLRDQLLEATSAGEVIRLLGQWID